MLGRSLVALSVLVFVFLSGCAEPKFVEGSENENDQETPQESVADCNSTFTSSGLCLSWYWEKKPTSSQMGSLIFKTYRLNTLDQTPIEVDLNSTPQVVLWMPSMGHGSTPSQTVRVDEGTYRTSNVFFIMPGEWEIRIQLKSGAEVTDETRITLVF